MGRLRDCGIVSGEFLIYFRLIEIWSIVGYVSLGNVVLEFVSFVYEHGNDVV